MTNRAGRVLAAAIVTTLGAGCGAISDMDAGRDEKVVAVWQRLDAATGAVRDEYTFRPDGTFAFDERKGGAPGEDHVTGTYVTAGTSITLDGTSKTDGKRSRLSLPYYASAQRLILSALYPQGARAGIVGTWSGTGTLEALDPAGKPLSTMTYGVRYAFAADGTVVRTNEGGDGEDMERGKYEVKPDGRYDLTLGEVLGTTLYLVDDAVLGPFAYRRAP